MARQRFHLLNDPGQPIASAIAQDVRDLLVLISRLKSQGEVADNENIEHEPEAPDVPFSTRRHR